MGLITAQLNFVAIWIENIDRRRPPLGPPTGDRTHQNLDPLLSQIIQNHRKIPSIHNQTKVIQISECPLPGLRGVFPRAEINYGMFINPNRRESHLPLPKFFNAFSLKTQNPGIKSKRPINIRNIQDDVIKLDYLYESHGSVLSAC